jgi:hypothetical protein
MAQTCVINLAMDQIGSAMFPETLRRPTASLEDGSGN